MRRIIKNKEKKIYTVTNIKKYVLFVVAGILALSSVFMTVETATSGVEISKLRQKENILSMEKRSLEGTLVKSLSVYDLEQNGSQMGYVKPTMMVYVSQSQEAVAKLP
jgi:hypothetical protein